VDTATSDLEGLGFNVSTQARQSDQPEKQVLDQSPASGQAVPKGTTITLIVSSGTGQATVPNVVGQDAATAANTLGQAGFKTATKTQASDTVEAGRVISTSPPAGAKAAKASTVTMVVSSGQSSTTTSQAPATTTTTASATATVPDVTGDREADASTKLRARGFSVASTNCTSSSVVTDQSPSGGTQAPRGSTVSISCGP
jgi:beta-lactam-binding protein with PASTA domain